MRYRIFPVILSVLAIFACRATQKSQLAEDQGEPIAQINSSRDQELYDLGFKVVGRSSDSPSTLGQIQYEITNDQGEPLTGGPAFALDLGRTKKGDVIFVWPNKVDRAIYRNYNWVAGQMNQYAKIVGLSMDPNTAQGNGQVCWHDGIRATQQRAINNALESRRTDVWCGAVVHQLVNQLLPSGSDYRQYGNCLEGGKIGACLAKKASFNDDEIRICQSLNYHFFAMLRFKAVVNGSADDRQWCLLDRWSVLPNFTCNLDWNEQTGEVLNNSMPVSAAQDTQGFFKKVACVTLKRYIESGGIALKNALQCVSRGVCSGRIQTE